MRPDETGSSARALPRLSAGSIHRHSAHHTYHRKGMREERTTMRPMTKKPSRFGSAARVAHREPSLDNTTGHVVDPSPAAPIFAVASVSIL